MNIERYIERLSILNSFELVIIYSSGLLTITFLLTLCIDFTKPEVQLARTKY